MERLTVKWTDKVYDTLDQVDILDNEYSKTNYNNLLTKLGEYEDLEEQGLLLRLPCNVGDEFYVIAYSDRKVTHVKCTGYCINNDTVNNINQSYIWIDSLENLKDFWKLSFDDFKIQCFKTQSEAEQKLKEVESD